MREPRVLSIYPPGQFMDEEKNRPDGSLGMLYLIGALRTIGIEADLVDASVGTDDDTLENTFYNEVMQPNGLVRVGMSWERIQQLFERKKYDIVLISSIFTFQTKMAVEVARIAKRVNPETLVVAGGVNARSIPHWFFQNRYVDLICTTEGERVIIDIVQRWARRESMKDIPGTMYRKDSTIRVKRLVKDETPKEIRQKNPIITVPIAPHTLPMNLDELPIPAWNLLPFDKYDFIDAPPAVPLVGHGQRFAQMMTSRGCPFKCGFCHISHEKEHPILSGDIGTLRCKSIPRVIQEINLLESLGVRRIFIEDDSLLAHKPRVKQLFGLLKNRGFTILGINGVNLVHIFKNVGGGKLEPDRDYLELFASAGFNQITFPVESGSQRILDKYATGKLNLGKMDVLKLVRVARDVGIVCPINMMIGFPDETVEEMMQSMLIAYRLVHDAGAPHVSFSIVIPFPGSTMYPEVVANGYLSEDFDPDDMNWKHANMTGTTVSREMVDRIRDAAWNTVNPPAYVQKRLEEFIGSRWTP